MKQKLSLKHKIAIGYRCWRANGTDCQYAS